MKRLFLVTIVLSLAITASGCVRRMVSINSQPQGAGVYFGRKLVGETPCDFEFLYYGKYHLELVKEGHANLNTTLRLKGPFYEYFPFSFVSEVLIPWQITNKHKFTFTLEEGQSKAPIISTIQQPQPALSEPELERFEEKE